MITEPILIVLAEDDDGHATLVERNLVRVGVANKLAAHQGRPGSARLLHGARHRRPASPQSILLLLDIKMPRVDGIEVLRQFKADPQTALIPVIMLTTTDDPREIKRCYELGCSVYITKPVDYQAFVEADQSAGPISSGRSHPRLRSAKP